MDRIRDLFSVENAVTAFMIVMLFTAGVAIATLIVAMFNAPTVYERIETCVAMEVYTRAECVIIESAR